MSTAAAILAAGGSTRFGAGQSKLRAPARGKPIVVWAVEAAVAAVFDDVIVVTGADDLTDLLPEGVRTVHNPRWDEGIATSLACAIDAVDRTAHDAIVVGLGDQPFVTTEAWAAVRDATAAAIVVATYGGRRGNPVRLAREVWGLLPTVGDHGARRLMSERPDLVSEVACAGNPADIDTQEDLTRWS